MWTWYILRTVIICLKCWDSSEDNFLYYGVFSCLCSYPKFPCIYFHFVFVLKAWSIDCMLHFLWMVVYFVSFVYSFVSETWLWSFRFFYTHFFIFVRPLFSSVLSLIINLVLVESLKNCPVNLKYIQLLLFMPLYCKT